jgi:hypothetical protein
MKNLIIILVFLISSGLIKAQTPKTVKIGNQVWMSENLGTTSSTTPRPSQTTSNNQTAGNSIKTQVSTNNPTDNSSRTQSSKNQNSQACSYQFSKPVVKMNYIDNRIKCCYCNNFATHSEIPNLQLQEEETYQAEKLFVHWQNIRASAEHQKMDIGRYEEFIINNYSSEMSSFEKYAESLPESGQSKTKEQIESELSKMSSNNMEIINEMPARGTAFVAAMTILYRNDFTNQTYTANMNRRVNKYELKSKGCDRHQGYCK